MSILRSTRDFFTLYRYACGQTDVPEAWHGWSALSLIAACVADRVDFYAIPTEPIRPNLYVLLVGPSAAGKGQAIKMATKFVIPGGVYEDAPAILSVHLYNGESTKHHLIDLLGQRLSRRHPNLEDLPKSRKWLVATELADEVPPGQVGVEMLRFLTKLWETPTMAVSQGSRTHGGVHIVNACINWLAGTTREWLRLSFPPDVISGGLVSRLLIVESGYMKPCQPQYPADREAVVAFLRAKIEWLASIHGTFAETAEAEAARKGWPWLMEEFREGSSIAAWVRRAAREHVVKLSMLLALGRDLPMTTTRPRLVITERDVRQAQMLLFRVRQHVQSVIEYASVPSTRMAVQYIADYLRQMRRVTESNFINEMRKRHGLGREETLETLRTLRAGHQAECALSPLRQNVWLWLGKKQLPKEEVEEATNE